MAKNKTTETGHYSVAAMRYAYVLSELNVSREAVERTKALLNQTEELAAALGNPVVTRQEKHAVIDRVFPGEMRNYLKVAVDNGKIGLLQEIIEAYEELERKDAGVITARLQYVTPPTQEQKVKMEMQLCKASGAKSVRWEMEEEPGLIDGFILSADGTEYDYSMRGRLKRLEETLTRR